MPPARLNPRLAKMHRTYAVDELARLFGTHRNTIRNWMKRGLEPLDSRKPLLFKGDAVQAFLEGRAKGRKIKTPPGMIYCVGCRRPHEPDGGMVDCVPLRGAVGDLQGLCPACGALMHRKVNLGRLDAAVGKLEVRMAKGAQHLCGSPDPCVNCAPGDPPAACASHSPSPSPSGVQTREVWAGESASGERCNTPLRATLAPHARSAPETAATLHDAAGERSAPTLQPLTRDHAGAD